MTAEERLWYLNRYNDEVKKKNEQEKKQYAKARVPSVSKPSMPSIRR